jgi:hypothetical protein
MLFPHGTAVTGALGVLLPSDMLDQRLQTSHAIFVLLCQQAPPEIRASTSIPRIPGGTVKVRE